MADEGAGSAAELERIARVIAEHDIDTVEIAFPDTWGQMRGKRVPAAQFLRSAGTKGIAAADAAFVFDIRGDIVEVPMINMATGYGDMQVVPELATFRPITWREGTAIVFADCISHTTHEPHVLDPRSILRGQVDRLAARGFDALVATELEFYFTTPDWQPAFDAIQCYSLTTQLEFEAPLREMRRALEGYGADVEASNIEYGPAQVEINLGPRDPIAAADLAMVFKHVVKEISRRHGLRATFMAKPWTGQSGSGLHIHSSLQRGGANAFAVAEDDGLFKNGLMRGWLGGLLEHTPALTAIALTNINGYKRATPYSFAPTHVTWGRDNRGVALRCLSEIGNATRIEYRGAAADANPYLVIAGVIAAGLDGLDRMPELPPIAAGDVYANPAGAREIPTSLEAAIAEFEGSRIAEAVGAEFTENFTTLLRVEAGRFGETITQWERDRYIEFA